MTDTGEPRTLNYAEKLAEELAARDTDGEKKEIPQPGPWEADPVGFYMQSVVLSGFAGHYGVNSRTMWRIMKGEKP